MGECKTYFEVTLICWFLLSNGADFNTDISASAFLPLNKSLRKILEDETAEKQSLYTRPRECYEKGYWLRSVKISFSSGPVGTPMPPSASSSLKLLSLNWSTSIFRNADADVSFLPSFLDISATRFDVSCVHARLIEQRLDRWRQTRLRTFANGSRAAMLSLWADVHVPYL